MKYDVIIVGAGVMGAASAAFLQKRGAKVLLLEKREAAAGATSKSAAIIRHHYSNELAADLVRQTIADLTTINKIGLDTGLVRSGYHMVVPEGMLAGARANVAMLNAMGIQAELQDLATSALKDMVNPDGVAAVVYEPDGGYASPVHTTKAFVKGFESLGGEYRAKCAVDALAGTATHVTGVVVGGETIEAGWVINAAGPWASQIGESVGIEMPLRVVREQHTVWEVRPDRPIPTGPVSNAVDAIYLRPLDNRRFLVGRGFPKDYQEIDPDNYNMEADEEFVSDVAERLERRLPAFEGATRIDAYASLYDVTPDWYPFVGPREGIAGYADACGGSGHGFKLAPAMARRLADWIVDGATDDSFRKLSHDRIAKNDLFVQKFGGNRG